MEFFKRYLALAIFLVGLSVPSFAEIGFTIAGKNENRTDFYVLSTSNQVVIPNIRREDERPGQLQFSLSGVKIERLMHAYADAPEWTMYLSDGSLLEFKLEEGLSAVTYQLRWHGKVGGPRELCFHYGQNNVSWYNAYQSNSANWPMDTSRTLPREAFANLRDYTLDDKREDFYLALEHFFIQSDGFAVFLDDRQPLFIRRDPNQGDPQLCFSTGTGEPYLSSTTDQSYTELTVHLYASIDIRHVMEYVIQYSQKVGHPKGIPDEGEFTYPTWSDSPTSANQESILTFAEDILKHGFSNQSEIILDDAHQTEDSELGFDKTKYPNAKTMIEKLHSKGFRLGVGISPQIHKAPNHTEAFFLKNNQNPTDFVDFSNAEACTWYEYLLRKLHFEDGVDAFQLSSVSVHSNLSFADPTVQKFPGSLSTKYIETSARLGNRVVSEVAYKTQHLPIFVKMTASPKATAKHLLETLIPNALSLSAVAGYSYFVPYPIGGFNPTSKPSAELYIRSVQAVTFMPSMAFTKTPWSYQNETVLKVTQKFVNLHAAHAKTLIHLAKSRASVGWPLIRPMWYLDPNDAETYRINDQFMVGDNLLVAPILREGQRERWVYLPKGLWADQHGTEYIGNLRIQVKVPLEELAYFTRTNKH